MAKALGRDTDEGLHVTYDLPDGGKAIRISKGTINWASGRPEGDDCVAQISLSVDGRVVHQETIEQPRASQIDAWAMFQLTDALGFEYAFACVFGKEKRG